ncbi:MAG: ATP-binding protein, partial [Elusimicrobia bacterium]|nr:ATP-binding protein [Elusimicrobiota bacterium]
VRHGEGPAARTQGHAEEARLVARVLAERRILSAGGSRGWAAAPLLQNRPDGPAPLGAVVVGFPEPRPPDPELEQTLLEISRLLRNARLMQQHLEHQQVLGAVTDQSADAIYITGQDSRIVSWNAAAEQLFGYSPDEAIGKAADFLVPPERMAELEAKNAQALAEGCAKNFETVRLRKDGSPVPVEATFFLLRDEKARPFGTVRVFRDITKRKEVERMKSELVSLVTHELRTPLTSIQGCAEHMLETWPELACEQRQHFLGVILSEAKRLGDLVTDFLDVSSLEAGGLPLRPSCVDLPGLARRAAELFAQNPGRVAFQVAFAPGSETAWADEDQLYRVIVNLASNAVKYSPPGGTVTLSARLEGADLEVSVADQGPGIPAQEHQKLFQKFYRAAGPVSRQTRGTGLGLAICKGIVESHHGRIWVESAPGRGTTFRFSFPRDGLKPS